jgi:hypothetical protein
MKSLLYIALWMLCISSHQIQAQSFVAGSEQIIPVSIFSLDSRGTGLFSRQYNTVLEVELPPGTVKWFYRFTSASNLTVANKLLKETDVLSFWVDKFLEDSTLVIENMSVTEDAPFVNIYLLTDTTSVDVFNSWISFNRSYFTPKYSVLNAASGWMVVEEEKFLSGKQYIGLMNPSIIQEAHILLEVAALVNKPLPGKNGWTLPELENLYSEMVNLCSDLPDSIITPEKIPIVASCFVNALENRWDAAQYKSLSEAEQIQWKNWQLLKCLPPRSKQDAAALTTLSRYIITGLWLTEKGEKMRLQFNGMVELEKNDGSLIKGKWSFDKDVFQLEFPGFRAQQYSAAKYTRNELEWKNNSTGRMLRMQRINRLP